MKRSAYLLFLFFFLSLSLFAQENLNHYKYIIVPQKYAFLKQPNQYGLNVLTKELLENKGFAVFFDDAQLPAELTTNKCDGLIAEIFEKNSMFSTNLTLILKDCGGQVVFKSKEGKSREKEYSESYNLALQDAFISLNDFKYAYKAPSNQTPKPLAQEVISKVETTPNQATPISKQIEETLYAQPVANGYQLVDSSPKKVLALLKTSVPDYFIASTETVNGVLLKKNGDWFFEYYQNGQLVSEKLRVKF